MKKVVLILSLILFPAIIQASTASDFTVNRQSTYAIPYGSDNVLIFDLTLPAPPEGETYQLKSITLHNAGTIDDTIISKLEIWEDGPSAGWNNDETEGAIVLQLPYFDTAINGAFRAYTKNDPWRRIFVTADIKSGFINERSFQIQLLTNSVVFNQAAATGPTDITITGRERKVTHDASTADAPTSPLAKEGEALSTSIIRWYFTDLANNEFGFKILDANLKEVARSETTDIAYLDETGLSSNTLYSGRRIVAFNDRGDSSVSVSSVFPSVRTLAPAVVQAVPPVTTTTDEVAAAEPEPAPEPTLFETIQTKIADIQRQINEFIKQLDELIKQSAATVFGALQGFLRAFFGK